MKPASSNGDYERPACSFVCGRGAAWGKPCAGGPKPDGQCGGIRECEPSMKEGRRQCRRPAAAGGPCETGPNPDGSCSQVHPPCVPRLTMRARRGRFTLQATILLALLLAAGFHFGGGRGVRPLTADPGPLSAKHANFTAQQGCIACHSGHEKDLGGLIRAVATPHGMNQECSVCHKFAGPADAPHNSATFAKAGRAAMPTDCRQCHTEHRGTMANISPMADVQCHACHKAQFERFDLGHPPFPKTMPRLAQPAIRFNHASHLREHFLKPEYKSHPAVNCADCHAASVKERNVATASFEAACARCHGAQITQTELTLLRLPEQPAKLDELDVADATPFLLWKLASTNAAKSYGERVRDFLQSVAKIGPEALAPSSTNALVAGLSPDLITRPAALWLEKKKFETTGKAPASGWYWFEDLNPELRHKPSGHADAVTKAWLEFSVRSANSVGASDKDLLRFQKELLHPQTGPGRCAKCHVVPASASEVAWNYAARPTKAQTHFSHGAHLGLRSCIDCHALDAKAGYDAQFAAIGARIEPISNFSGVPQSSCVTCHAEGKVRHDCRLCHEYHRDPVLTPSVLNSLLTKQPAAR